MVKTISARAIRKFEEQAAAAVANEENDNERSEESKNGDGFDDLPAAIDKLSSNDVIVRGNGIHSLILLLQSSNIGSSNAIAETLNDNLVEMLENPSSLQEGKQCCKLLKLLALSIGAEEDDFYDSWDEILTRLVIDSNTFGEELRRYALFTLTFISFICKSEPNIALWTLCEQVLTDNAETAPQPLSLKATAVECWLLLSTVMSNEEVLRHSKEVAFEAFHDVLDYAHQTGDVDLSSLSETSVKATLVTGIAYLFEVADQYLGGRDAVRTPEVLCAEPTRVQEASSLVRVVAQEFPDYREFQEAQQYVLFGTEIPENIVQLQDAEVNVNSFRAVIVLEALRKVLGNHLYSAVRLYPVVSDILRLEHTATSIQQHWKDELQLQDGKISSEGRVLDHTRSIRAARRGEQGELAKQVYAEWEQMERVAACYPGGHWADAKVSHSST